MKIGVLGAMPEEVSAVLSMLERPTTTHVGSRDYTHGIIAGHDIIAAHSRIGKVASASAAVELLSRFGIDQLLFTGLAGTLRPEVKIGDIVIAEGLIQHDMDASPLFPPLEVPLTGCSRFTTSPEVSRRLAKAARIVLSRQKTTAAHHENPPKPDTRRVIMGDVATGDQFIADAETQNQVGARVPSAVCVEMEGAAVAQVCQEYRTPFGIVRTISDGADTSAASDFTSALCDVTIDLSAAIIEQYLLLL